MPYLLRAARLAAPCQRETRATALTSEMAKKPKKKTNVEQKQQLQQQDDDEEEEEPRM